jgi:glycosyltransferase involved in cell wall biosynthesis
MRIVAFSTLFPPNVVGGAEKTVETLMLGLADRGVEAHVVTTDPAEDRSRREGPLQVHRVRLRNLYWPHAVDPRPPVWQRALWHARDIHNVPMATAASQLLHEIRPDAVMTFNIQGFSTSVWSSVKSLGRPLVHVIQDYWLLCPRTTMFKRGRNCQPSCLTCRLVTASRRRATRQVDAVVGISQAVLREHREEGLFAGVPVQTVIHNSRRMPGGRTAPAAEDGRLRIGFFGRVSREKGFEFLLSELARLRSPAWTLVVGGRYPADYLAGLQRRHSLDQVQFLGFIEPERFYRQIDLLVVPSLWREPLGSVAIEAMASGVPAIVSARGGLPELVGGFATSGFVFDPDVPGSLRRLLDRFVDEPGRAAALRPEVLRHAARFSVQRQVDAFAALLDDIQTGGRQRLPEDVAT